jgi:hypothetical protein
MLLVMRQCAHLACGPKGHTQVSALPAAPTCGQLTPSSASTYWSLPVLFAIAKKDMPPSRRAPLA